MRILLEFSVSFGLPGRLTHKFLCFSSILLWNPNRFAAKNPLLRRSKELYQRLQVLGDIKDMATEPKVARLASDTTQAAATAANETIQQSKAALENGANQARRMMEESMSQAPKLAEGIFKSAQEAMDFGRGNVEALTQATQTYVAGTQDLSRQTFALFQSLSDQALENARAFATVRSVKDAAELQANFARQTLEKVMGETAKLQEASFRLAEQASAPLAQRMTLAMERAAKPLSV